MSKKGKNQNNQKNKNQEKIAAKKAAVLGTESKNRMPLLVAAIGVILIAGVAFFYVFQPAGQSTATASAPVATSNTFVSFPVSLFDDGKARHFEHVDGNMTIRYFILKSSDGVVRAAFDACDVCWPAGKGYYQEGDHMVCRNCGRRFASVLVNEVQGGCNPAPLNRNLENNKLVIQIKDIQQGRQYFNFDGKV
ncbi:MAG: DUF2318 domain-containing protein [bacterium]|nr:DUF2318 domain-containing protein [bacterium]